MKVAQDIAWGEVDDLIAELGGGSLVIYSVGRPPDPNRPVERSKVLATFTFAVPAFSPGPDGYTANFTASTVPATGVGTPGFARAFKADSGDPVADFSAGAGDAEVKLSEVAAVVDYPISVIDMRLDPSPA